MMKHYVVRVEIDVFDLESPLEAARDMAYWLLEEDGAKRAVYEVIDKDTNISEQFDLEYLGYESPDLDYT